MMRLTERGVALGTVTVMALVFGIGAFSALTMALNLSRREVQDVAYVRARYSAEAGLVWAMQRLWVTPAECFTATSDFSIDSDGAGPLPSTVVDITATPCPSVQMQLKAKVVY